ncbi:MAG: alpha/beta fold hydrolase [Zavarzinia sp.]|nr:alpha/beta fold hydrolase [Zavarzinia sp.]
MRIRLLDAGGIRTRVLESGTAGGLPLLLLHPVGFSADLWWPNMPALSASRPVCAPDLLGHGFSDLRDPAGRIGHGPILEHVAALVDALGWNDYAIAGSSFGAQIALLLALRHGPRVRRLVVIGSGTALQTEAETIATLRRTRTNAMRALEAPSAETCRTRLANLCHGLPDGAAEFLLPAQLTAYARAGAAEAYAALLDAMTDGATARPYRVRERLGEIAAPVLLLWGRQDPRAALVRAEEALGILPNARLTVFEDCGHLPSLEHPAAFNGTVSEFLAGA